MFDVPHGPSPIASLESNLPTPLHWTRWHWTRRHWTPPRWTPPRWTPPEWHSLLPIGFFAALACGGEAGVTFHRDVKPLFDRRCAVCHYTGNGYADLENPFNTGPGIGNGTEGLVGSRSVWNDGHQYGPEYNVVPYEPENSYLLEKVTNRELLPETCSAERFSAVQCLQGEAGFFMPPAPRQLRKEQIDMVRQWILEGADPEAFEDRRRYAPHRFAILNLFGNYSNLSEDELKIEVYPNVCGFVDQDPGCNQCASCHRENGPYHPQGVTAADFIDVSSDFRTDLELVVPGKPEESFLMMKLEASMPTSDIGAPMPHGYEAFSEQQVALLRQWIAEGAKND